MERYLAMDVNREYYELGLPIIKKKSRGLFTRLTSEKDLLFPFLTSCLSHWEAKHGCLKGFIYRKKRHRKKHSNPVRQKKLLTLSCLVHCAVQHGISSGLYGAAFPKAFSTHLFCIRFHQEIHFHPVPIPGSPQFP